MSSSTVPREARGNAIQYGSMQYQANPNTQPCVSARRRKRDTSHPRDLVPQCQLLVSTSQYGA